MRIGPSARGGGAADGVGAIDLAAGRKADHRVGDAAVGPAVTLPQRDVHGPVVVPTHGEFAGAVHRIDDPHAVGAHPRQIVDRLLGQHGVVGPIAVQTVQDQHVGPLVAGVAEVVWVVEPQLLAHRKQQLTRFVGHLGGQRRIGQAHRFSRSRR